MDWQQPSLYRHAGMTGTWRLILVRILRSLGQGALFVDFALYARALDWSAVYLGAVLGAAMLVNAGLTALFGPLSDRLGCRRLLLAYEMLIVGVGVMAFSSGARWVVTLAAILGGFGRGSTGAAGPFGPVEQSWMASIVPLQQWGSVLSWNAAAGAFGAALGALLATLPAVWTGLPHPTAADYRPLFLLTSAAAALALPLLWSVPDRQRHNRRQATETTNATAQNEKARQRERGLLLQLAGLNVLNGAGNGLVGPLIAYWFAACFARGPEEIGPVIALSLALAGVSGLGAGWLSRRIGLVPTVLWMRGTSLALLFALPFVPSFLAAAAMYILRSGLNRGTMGSRQALTLGLVREHNRGMAASVNAVSMQLPRVIGPAIAGIFFATGAFSVPFLIAGLFQGLYLIFYRRLFGRYGHK